MQGRDGGECVQPMKPSFLALPSPPELIRIDWLCFRAAEKAMVPGAERHRTTEEEFRRTKGGTDGRTDMLRRSQIIGWFDLLVSAILTRKYAVNIHVPSPEEKYLYNTQY